ncbi:MAG TPA: four helix bundle protein [Puia sp.]|nr:four helix bundle protein [Puia sp.]
MLNLAHKQLKVYGMSIELVKNVYLLTQTFPREEQFILASQLKRAAISVCSNIAEGSSRSSRMEKKDFMRFRGRRW